MTYFTFPTLAVGWSIARLDIDVDALTKLISSAGLGLYPTTSIKGKHPPQNERYTSSSPWNERAVPGRKPHTSFFSEGLDTYSCSLFFYAESIDIDIWPDIEQIKAWSKPDPELGRPAIVQFQCGEFTFIGAITDVSIQPGERWYTNAYRSVTVDITIRERQWPPPDDVMTRDPSKPPHLSRYVTVKDQETYEDIAKAQYGDPMIGVFLRQDHLLAFPLAGDVVFCPDKSYFRARRLSADSPLLGESSDNVAALSALVDELEGEVYEPIV